jgi:hypothetical protein
MGTLSGKPEGALHFDNITLAWDLNPTFYPTSDSF